MKILKDRNPSEIEAERNNGIMRRGSTIEIAARKWDSDDLCAGPLAFDVSEIAFFYAYAGRMILADAADPVPFSKTVLGIKGMESILIECSYDVFWRVYHEAKEGKP